MKSIIFFVATAAAAVVAGGSDTVSPIPTFQRDVVVGDNVPDMVFTGPLTVGGPDVTLEGTAESVYKQILKLNPSYNAWDFPEHVANMKAKGVTDESVDIHSFATAARLNCDSEGDDVWCTDCREGIDYLAKLNGVCNPPKGKSGCGRVSCSWKCGIFVCNNEPIQPAQVLCAWVAIDAATIVDKCQTPLEGWCKTKGQIIHETSSLPPLYNALIKWQQC